MHLVNKSLVGSSKEYKMAHSFRLSNVACILISMLVILLDLSVQLEAFVLSPLTTSIFPSSATSTKITSKTSTFASLPVNFQMTQNMATVTRNKSKQKLKMCICINCKYVTNCAAYHFVEERHSQPHMTDDPTFTPRDGSPTIHVNIRSQYEMGKNEELKKMWREYKQEEVAALNKQEQQSINEGTQTDAIGPTTYNFENVGEVSYEYDVVKCEDYVEEMGCWVANMPEEIRLANPDFVPT